MVDHPSSILSGTKVGVALPAIDQGEERPFAGVDVSICSAPGRLVWIGLVDPLEYRMVADRQRVYTADVAWDQMRWSWWLRVEGLWGCANGGSRWLGSARGRAHQRWREEGR